MKQLMIISNGLVYDEDKGFVKKDIYIENDHIAYLTDHDTDHDTNCDTDHDADHDTDCDTDHGKCESASIHVEAQSYIDATDCYVIPGLIDTHIHGCAGYDVCDGGPEALRHMVQYELANGVTAICPTTMSLSVDRLEAILGDIADSIEDSKGVSNQSKYCADILGINLEGPFLSKDKCGAQNLEYLRLPDIDVFDRLYEAAGNSIKICDIAPELPGSEALIRYIKDKYKDISISIAHSNAGYATAIDAFENGANRVTHLYNGMSPFGHRESGIPGAVADREDVWAELICDGIHVHSSVIRATFKMLGDDRIVLISDSMRACGLEDGEYELGGLDVIKNGKECRLHNGSLAGSASTLMDCLRMAVDMGVPFTSAVKCATVNPAKSIGCYKERGSIEAGKLADIVVLDKEMNIREVIKSGRSVCH